MIRLGKDFSATVWWGVWENVEINTWNTLAYQMVYHIERNVISSVEQKILGSCPSLLAMEYKLV